MDRNGFLWKRLLRRRLSSQIFYLFLLLLGNYEAFPVDIAGVTASCVIRIRRVSFCLCFRRVLSTCCACRDRRRRCSVSGECEDFDSAIGLKREGTEKMTGCAKPPRGSTVLCMHHSLAVLRMGRQARDGSLNSSPNHRRQAHRLNTCPTYSHQRRTTKEREDD
ncbi:uncharacterized protein EI97DRAFT_308662 [Westerdykella ornata]|uniref:Uncharacterized protein n=1 Tax=Westerdykella ornata TaxID=318751 RepID=A0A6A6JN43_WESOR|nr:uncharacterized protein EI97DRAFT_308662 [Westerdykella ornata]KAF2277076.1 hypothetical protein EI97DRAFT_308662 [Westerdykella ornata]